MPIRKKILVTGGSGFIGSHTVEELLKQGYDVIVYDDFSTGKAANLDDAKQLNPSLRILRASTFAHTFLESCIKEVDAVLHLAALVSVRISIENPAESFGRNVVGFMNVLNLCRKHSKPLTYASSAAVYGAWEGEQHETRGMINPLSPYGADKCV